MCPGVWKSERKSGVVLRLWGSAYHMHVYIRYVDGIQAYYMKSKVVTSVL